MSSSKNRTCIACDDFIPHTKRWGLYNLCSGCDDTEEVAKSMGVMIADGKTDYHIQVVRNPTPNDVKMIQQIGRAWDPRSQLVSINKVSS